MKMTVGFKAVEYVGEGRWFTRLDEEDLIERDPRSYECLTEFRTDIHREADKPSIESKAYKPYWMS